MKFFIALWKCHFVSYRNPIFSEFSSAELPKVLSCLSHKVCKELDLQTANFLASDANIYEHPRLPGLEFAHRHGSNLELFISFFFPFCSVSIINRYLHNMLCGLQ